MPQCATCRAFFPPQFLITHEDGGKQCFFCVNKTKFIQSQGSVFEKEEVIRKYMEYTKEIASGENVRDLVVENEVKKYGKE